ncbi:MAG: response regulator transcription factor [Candidatus Competibacteraceae bacterium]
MSDTDSILVVDDDPRILRLVGHYLQREGYTVRLVATVREAREQLSVLSPGLILLDVGLPGEDGFVFAREIRSQSDIPIIMLTGRVQTVDKVVGLELGADDYITKPFEERELLARIRSLLRRYRGSPAVSLKTATGGGVARFAGWRLDLTQHELFSSTGETVYLTSHEFRLLETFVLHPGRVLSRDALMDRVAGRDWNPLDRSIDVLVAKLRKKIEPNPAQPTLIKAVRGEGYKFTTEVVIE